MYLKKNRPILFENKPILCVFAINMSNLAPLIYKDILS